VIPQLAQNVLQRSDPYWEYKDPLKSSLVLRRSTKAWSND
jgi:hypothetical protein